MLSRIFYGKFNKVVLFEYVMNKKGLEMVMTTVIMIVLSIGVLTLLIIFLNSQTGFLSDFFKVHSSESNVDAVVSSCNNYATSESAYSYCCEKKNVIVSKDSAVVKMTCDESRGADWSSGRIKELSCSGIICS